MLGKLSIRQTRALVLALLVVTALVTAGTYLARRQYRESHPKELPPRIPRDTRQSRDFTYSKTEEGRTEFTIHAAEVKEQSAGGRSVLVDVEIITYGRTGNRHDRIYTKECEYDAKAGEMRSRAEVEIELANLPGQLSTPDAKPEAITKPADDARPSIFVKTSGVVFSEKTGIVTTDQPLDFRFDGGSGRAVGAIYDSRQRTLHLKSAVELEAINLPLAKVLPAGPAAPRPAAAAKSEDAPVFVNAAELDYRQQDGFVSGQRVQIRRKLPEAYRELNADHGEMWLDSENRVKSAVFAGHVRLNENLPTTKTQEARESHLSGNELKLMFKEAVLEQAYVSQSVQLDVVTARERSRSTAGELSLLFGGPESTLSQVDWGGGLRMVATPLGPAGDVRTLVTERAHMLMKPGGRELDAAVTNGPGRIELTPVVVPAGVAVASRQAAGVRRSPAEHRVVSGDRLWMKFGDDNQLDMLTANKNARIEMYPLADARRSGPQAAPGAPRIATSDDLTARFGQDSHQLETLEQTGNFHYRDGESEAKAERSVYTAADDKIQLTGAPGRNPEVWDSATHTTARLITLDNRNNSGVAEQDVITVYQPQANGTKPGVEKAAARSAKVQNQVPGPLAAKDPVYVAAQRMVTNSKTGITRYEAGASGPRARLWQNHDVIEARSLVLERDTRRLTAEGQVTTVLVESSTNAARPASGPPTTDTRGGSRAAPGVAASVASAGQASAQARPITIAADTMVYTDNDHKAHYEGRVTLHRQESVMKSSSLDAYLVPPDEAKAGESRLERALARGAVEIADVARSGARRAAAELAEYTTSDEKMVLSGGSPYVFDEQRGYTRGRQLTYYVHDDSIFVHGDSSSRTYTEQKVVKKRR